MGGVVSQGELTAGGVILVLSEERSMGSRGGVGGGDTSV